MHRSILHTIVFYEIAGYLRSAKFLYGFLFIMMALVTSVTINLNMYCDRLDEYSSNTLFPEETTRVTVLKPPHVLSIFVSGKEDRLGMMAQLSDSYIPLKTTGRLDRLSLRDLVRCGIISIDSIFVIKILFSLFVVFFSFDTVSGEKTRGTLRLVLSNGIPRHIIIMGKTIAGALVIGGLILFSFALSCVMISINPKVVLTSTDIIRLGAIAGAAFLYLMFFHVLCIAISTLTETSAASLHTLMFVWVIIVIIFPNLIQFIFDPSRTMPSEESLGSQRYQAILAVEKKKLQYYERMNGWAEAVYHIEHDVHTRSLNMVRRARSLSSLSPSFMFNEIVVRMACTGIDDHDRFLSYMRQYWNDSIRFRNTDPANYGRSEAIHEKKIHDLVPYRYQSEPVAESLKGSLLPLSALTILAIAVFASALFGFMRKDVR